MLTLNAIVLKQENIVKVALEKFGGLHIAFNNAGVVLSLFNWG